MKNTQSGPSSPQTTAKQKLLNRRFWGAHPALFLSLQGTLQEAKDIASGKAIVGILKASQTEKTCGWFMFLRLGLPLYRPLDPLTVRERCRIIRAHLSLPPVGSTRKPLANLVLSVSLEPDLATPSCLSSKG